MPPDTDWRQKVDHECQGLGANRTYMEPSGKYRSEHSNAGPFFHLKDSIRHNRDISRAWTTFIFDKSDGFTQVGVERLNDTIRSYVLAIREHKPRRAQIFSRPGRDSTLKNSSWQNLKMRLPHPLTSPAPSTVISPCSSTLARLWISCLGLGSACHRATWHFILDRSRATTTKSL